VNNKIGDIETLPTMNIEHLEYSNLHTVQADSPTTIIMHSSSSESSEEEQEDNDIIVEEVSTWEERELLGSDCQQLLEVKAEKTSFDSSQHCKLEFDPLLNIDSEQYQQVLEEERERE